MKPCFVYILKKIDHLLLHFDYMIIYMCIYNGVIDYFKISMRSELILETTLFKSNYYIRKMDNGESCTPI